MKPIDPRKVKLTPYEQDLEDNLDISMALTGKKKAREMEKLKLAAKNYLRKKNKEQRINIRVFAADLERIKEIAAEEGLPYQTLVTSILHKFSTGRLVIKERG